MRQNNFLSVGPSTGGSNHRLNTEEARSRAGQRSQSMQSSLSSPQLRLPVGLQSADEGGISDAPPPYEPASSRSNPDSNLIASTPIHLPNLWSMALSSSQRQSDSLSSHSSMIRASTAPATAQNSDAEEDYVGQPSSSTFRQTGQSSPTSPSFAKRSPTFLQSNLPPSGPSARPSKRKSTARGERGRDPRAVASASASRRTSPDPQEGLRRSGESSRNRSPILRRGSIGNRTQTPGSGGATPTLAQISLGRNRRSDSLSANGPAHQNPIGNFGFGLGLTSISNSNNSSSTEDELIPGTNSGQQSMISGFTPGETSFRRRKRAATHDGSASTSIFPSQHRSQAFHSSPQSSVANLPSSRSQITAPESSESTDGPQIFDSQANDPNSFNIISASRPRSSSTAGDWGQSTALEAAEALLNWRGGPRNFVSNSGAGIEIESNRNAVEETREDQLQCNPPPESFKAFSLRTLLPDSSSFQRFYPKSPLRVLLYPLRLLAVVPGSIGTFWLLRNSVLIAWEQGHLRREVHSASTSAEIFNEVASMVGAGNDNRGRIWKGPCSLDFAVASLWSISTALYALSFTTLLLRRWLLYYTLLPSLIRLAALQAICWPLVRLTLYVCGSQRPVLAWVVIGTTTCLSDIIARWLTSNIADAPTRSARRKKREGNVPNNLSQEGEESGRGARLLRAVIGGVPAEEEEEEEGAQDATDFNTDLELDSALDLSTEEEMENLHLNSTTEFEETGEESTDVQVASRQGIGPVEARLGRRKKRRKEAIGIGIGIGRPRIRSRRVFHWDVAVRRNVLPICALGYLTMVVLLLLE